MGGGRDKDGAPIYKQVNGQYIRIGAYQDKEREANRLIDNFIANPSNVRSVLKYLKAIDDRDRKLVLDLDRRLKNGELGTGQNQEDLSNIRKKLLELAAESPEAVTRINQQTKQKTGRNLITKQDIDKRIAELQTKYVGKRIRIKENLESWYGHYTPAGTEGTVLKVDAQIIHAVPKLGISNTVTYKFLIDTKYGKYWLSAKQLEST